MRNKDVYKHNYIEPEHPELDRIDSKNLPPHERKFFQKYLQDHRGPTNNVLDKSYCDSCGSTEVQADDINQTFRLVRCSRCQKILGVLHK